MKARDVESGKIYKSINTNDLYAIFLISLDNTGYTLFILEGSDFKKLKVALNMKKVDYNFSYKSSDINPFNSKQMQEIIKGVF